MEFRFKNQLLKFKTKTKRKKKNKICFVGATRGIGVTHISLSIANFLHSVEKRKVLYIEVGESSRLVPVVGKKQVWLGDTLVYEYKGVYYLLACSIKETSLAIKSIDADIIVDLGMANADTKEILLQCDKKVLVLSLQSWMIEKTTSAMREINKRYDIREIILLDNLTSKQRKKGKLDQYGFYDIPFIENPFMLEESDFKALEKVLA